MCGRFTLAKELRVVAARFGVNCGHGYDEAASRYSRSSAIPANGFHGAAVEAGGFRLVTADATRTTADGALGQHALPGAKAAGYTKDAK
ncbi:MAG: hypothetical protein ABSD58_05125 [Verrucomicrobiia bacterium]